MREDLVMSRDQRRLPSGTRGRCGGIPGARAVLLAAAVTSPAAAQSTERASIDSAGAEGDGNSYLVAVSQDGVVAAFTSFATNLVVIDTNTAWDVFVHDRSTGRTERVSVDSSGGQGNGDSYVSAISADGRFVLFGSCATDLVAGDTNGCPDLFVRDRLLGTTERVSVDSSGAEGDDISTAGVISDDGQIVVFSSGASNLVANDTNGTFDVFVHDRSTGVTERVSIDSTGAQSDGDSGSASCSADGQIVAFASSARNLVPADVNRCDDVFVRDRSAGTTERVSVDGLGAEGDDMSRFPSISKDGRLVAFDSLASNLVAGDDNELFDVFVRDRFAGTTERVSVDSTGAQANGGSYAPSISGDGLRVAFQSDASSLVAGDTNQYADAFLRDRSTGETRRVSVDSAGGEAARGGTLEAISEDGDVVAFHSDSDDLVSGDNNGKSDVFVRELCTTPAAWSSYGGGFPGTNGVPAFTAQSNPTFGATVTLALDNSLGAPTVGTIFIGYQRATIPTNRGGDLLVEPSVVVPISFWYGGDTFTGDIASDKSLCGMVIDLQAVEVDAGAAKGFSFTAGLELVIGM
jgi:hypothetical protein